MQVRFRTLTLNPKHCFSSIHATQPKLPGSGFGFRLWVLGFRVFGVLQV